jgi:hypothetical protein
MGKLRFLAILVSSFAWSQPAPAQSDQPASPAGPPEILVLVHQEFQFGQENARQKLDTSISRACNKINVPSSWIDLESVTGKPERLSFDPFDSFEQAGDALANWGQVFAAHPELAQMQNELRALQTSERTIIAVRRSDLSYQANSIDLSKARFMRVLEVRVRPGHDEDFVDAFKVLRAAYLKIRADMPWVVYQVNVGMPSPTFLAFVPMRSLKQNDDLLSWRSLLREAEGDTGAGRTQQVARDAYISSESNLYAISPEMSHVSKEFAAGDPAFWSPQPVAAADPGSNHAVPGPSTQNEKNPGQ